MKTIRIFFEEELAGLDKMLKTFNNGKDWTPLERLREEMALIRACQAKVHGFITQNGFIDAAEEIEYHKSLYPRLRALHIFRVELHLLKKNLPALGGESIRAYYGEQLKLLFGYIRRYEFLYSYFKLKADDLDGLFFTESGNRQSVLLPVLSDFEVVHTTETGYLFARFIAYEMLFAHIMQEMESGGKPFRWTGEALNLIEVLHGIHLTGQVNDGEVGLLEWFKGMGDFFGVELGIPKKGFDGLKKRKKLSRTHFIDRIRDELVNKMDEEDDWQREQRRKNKAGF
ncbi:MAG TPA: RteC domain-containing protein [Mucilaginibacter sp.]